ncbi:histidine kinase [Citricoccus nitrophenolicus]|nr:histidine kinase [Citricoccus muralis]
MGSERMTPPARTRVRPLPRPSDDTRMPALLAAMRIILHVTVAGLLAIGLVRSLVPAIRSGEHGLVWQIASLAAVFAIVYLAGTVLEKRRSDRSSLGEGQIVVRAQLAWLIAVTLTWLGLMAVHVDFAWLAFPLFFLHLHVVGSRSVPIAIVLVVLLTVTVFLGFWWHEGRLGIGAVVGPVIGAVVAVAMSAAYSLFYAEARTQRRIAAELQATRDHLARSERHAGAMRERERWAQDLHDTLAQGLASVVLLSRAAQEQHSAEPLAGQLQQIERSAVENLAQARALVEQRGPGAGLSAELLATCRTTQDTARSAGSDLTVEFHGPDAGPGGEAGDPPMGAEAATIVLRVAQSALANVLQHARARRCVVTFVVHRDEVTLDVFDDGAGRGDRPEGFGITTMRQRANTAAGTLTVEDAFEPRNGDGATGTVVALSVPRWGERA